MEGIRPVDESQASVLVAQHADHQCRTWARQYKASQAEDIAKRDIIKFGNFIALLFIINVNIPMAVSARVSISGTTC